MRFISLLALLLFAQPALAYTPVTPVSGGGTGLSTLGAASLCLKVNAGGTGLTYDTCGITTAPGGADTNVQFNDAGSFGGSSAFTFNKTTGAVSVTSASTTALAVGLAGVTNPAFSVDASTASSATGWKVGSRAAGNGAFLTVTSSGANEPGIISPLGTNTALQFRGVGTGTAIVNGTPLVSYRNTDPTANNATTVAFINSNSAGFSALITAINEVQGASGSGSLHFVTFNAGTGTDVMKVTSTGAVNITSPTQTTNIPALSASQTWNNVATTFTGMLLNVTRTSAATASAEFRIQNAGTDVVRIGNMGGVPGVILGSGTSSTILQIDYNSGTAELTTGASGVFRFGASNGDMFYSSIGYLGPVGTGAALTIAPSFGATKDLFMTRRGAANWSLGAADAATAVAQTLSTQSIVAGTSDTNGQDFSITGSTSTGTGTQGNILFKTGFATTTGSTVNTAATILTLGPSQLLGSSTTPVASFAQTWNTSGVATGLKLNITNTASNAASLIQDLQVGSVTKFNVGLTGTVTSAGSFQAGTNAAYLDGSVGRLYIPGTTGYVGFTTNSVATSVSTIDTFLTRAAAANLQFGNFNSATPIAQTVSTQGSRPGTDTNVGGANLIVQSGDGTGTGAVSAMVLQTPIAVASGSGAQTMFTVATLQNKQFGVGPTASETFTTNITSRTATFAGDVSLGWTTANSDTGTLDLIMRRGGAALLVLGGANSATPVSQTIGVQGARPGTDTNVSGGSLTIEPALGTGTGAPATVTLRAPIVTTSGTGTQTYATALTVSGTALTAAVAIVPDQLIGITGTNTNNDAQVGAVGEYLLGTNTTSGTAVSLTSAADTNVATIALTSGDWDVYANVVVNPANTTVSAYEQVSISGTSATGAGANDFSFRERIGLVTGNGSSILSSQGSVKRITVPSGSPVTYYAVVNVNFSTSTCVAWGNLWARRVR